MKLLGPRQVYGNTLGTIESQSQLLTIHAQFIEGMSRRLGAHPQTGEPYSVVVDSDTRICYINHGRLLIDCPCGAGVPIDQEWKLGACFGCGRVFAGDGVLLPANLEKVLRLLEKRPTPNRNFDPRTETLEIVAEEHG